MRTDLKIGDSCPYCKTPLVEDFIGEKGEQPAVSCDKCAELIGVCEPQKVKQ